MSQTLLNLNVAEPETLNADDIDAVDVYGATPLDDAYTFEQVVMSFVCVRESVSGRERGGETQSQSDSERTPTLSNRCVRERERERERQRARARARGRLCFRTSVCERGRDRERGRERQTARAIARGCLLTRTGYHDLLFLTGVS